MRHTQPDGTRRSDRPLHRPEGTTDALSCHPAYVAGEDRTKLVCGAHSALSSRLVRRDVAQDLRVLDGAGVRVRRRGQATIQSAKSHCPALSRVGRRSDADGVPGVRSRERPTERRLRRFNVQMERLRLQVRLSRAHLVWYRGVLREGDGRGSDERDKGAVFSKRTVDFCPIPSREELELVMILAACLPHEKQRGRD